MLCHASERFLVPKSEYGQWRGFPACHCLIEWLTAYEKYLLHLGVIKFNLDVYQLIGGYRLSGGTHSKGGAYDIGQYDEKSVSAARNGGAAGWHRTPAQGFVNHQHGVLKGCPHAVANARGQVVDLERNFNGLVGKHRHVDDGPRAGVLWPLRTWQEGIDWFHSQLTPQPVIPENVRAHVRVATLNLNAKFAPGYEGRVHDLAGVVQAMKADVLLTQESGTYADGEELNKALGWGGVRGKSFILHGDDGVAITTAIHWNPALSDLRAEGKIVNPSGRDATWVILQDRATGREALYVSVHFDYRKGYAKQRQAEAKFVAENVVNIRKAHGAIPVIIGGDFNQDKDDRVDGPGRGLAGYADAETVATSKKRLNTTFNGFKKKFGVGRRLDRFMVKGRVLVDSIDTFPGYPGTDHNGVVIEVAIGGVN